MLDNVAGNIISKTAKEESKHKQGVSGRVQVGADGIKAGDVVVVFPGALSQINEKGPELIHKNKSGTSQYVCFDVCEGFRLPHPTDQTRVIEFSPSDNWGGARFTMNLASPLATAPKMRLQFDENGKRSWLEIPTAPAQTATVHPPKQDAKAATN